MNNIWFIADTHFGHKNILKHMPKRIDVGNIDMTNYVIKQHDEWLINIWNKYINKNDTVYIIGDFSFHNKENTEKLLYKLKGEKHLFVGNHDSSSLKIANLFKSVRYQDVLTIKKNNYSFLDDNILIHCNHIPCLSWYQKSYGSIMVHGHVHGKLDEINHNSYELRVDVGIDSELSGFKPISLEMLYNYFIKKVGDSDFKKYVQNNYKCNNINIL